MNGFKNLPPALQGGIFMICSGAVVAVLWGTIRLASAELHPFVVAFWRSIFGLIALTPLLVGIARSQGAAALKSAQPSLHVLRGVLSTFSIAGIFYAIYAIPMGQAMALNYSAPLFTTLGAFLFLGERLRWRRVLAVLIGFGGMLIAVQPGTQSISLGTVAGLVGAITMAGALLVVRRAGTLGDSSSTIILYGNTMILPGALLLALPYWAWPKNWEVWGLLILIGVLSTVAQTFFNKAFAVAEANAVMPFDFMRFVFVTMVAIIFFAEPLNALTVLGAAIILSASVYIAYRERKVGDAHEAEPRGAA